ncbi:MAG: DUF1624 domain-containing protein [Ruminococcaceae bacterium]|nr:DUF1624 domain-containing protein [Oscillospiraceae bacterium]
MKEFRKGRIHYLDTIRGITIISMIIYHTVWDLSYIYDVRILQNMGNWGYIWQQSICITFILLSGFCFSLGKHKLKHSLIVFVSGSLITIVTAIFMRNNIIIFGVLTFLGSAMLFSAFAENILLKLSPNVFLPICFALFLITRDINKGYLGFYGIKILSLPRSLYVNNLSAFFGFPHLRFFSTDYFSFLPWLFLFLTGYFIYRLAIQKAPLKRFGKNIPLINFLGRHSLIVYLLHQPIIYFITYLIFK